MLVITVLARAHQIYDESIVHVFMKRVKISDDALRVHRDCDMSRKILQPGSQRLPYVAAASQPSLALAVRQGLVFDQEISLAS